MRRISVVILLSLAACFVIPSFAQIQSPQLPTPMKMTPKSMKQIGPAQISLQNAALTTVNCADREFLVRDARYNEEYRIFFHTLNGKQASTTAEQTQVCNAANLHAGQHVNVTGTFTIHNGQKVVYNATISAR